MENLFPYLFDVSFDDEKRDVVDHVLTTDSSNGIDLQRFQSIVLTLNNDRVITAENSALRDLLIDGRSGIGWKTDLLYPPVFRKVDQKTDALLLDGVASLEFEHNGVLSDGRPCTFLTFKRRLDELRNPSFAILVVSRPVAIIGSSEAERRRSLGELVGLLQQLDAIDQSICRAYSKGDSTKEIALSVGLTTRTVENRRQKILDQFGFERPIEIVKLLVRLEEHGLI